MQGITRLHGGLECGAQVDAAVRCRPLQRCQLIDQVRECAWHDGARAAQHTGAPEITSAAAAVPGNEGAVLS